LIQNILHKYIKNSIRTYCIVYLQLKYVETKNTVKSSEKLGIEEKYLCEMNKKVKIWLYWERKKNFGNSVVKKYIKLYKFVWVCGKKYMVYSKWDMLKFVCDIVKMYVYM